MSEAAAGRAFIERPSRCRFGIDHFMETDMNDNIIDNTPAIQYAIHCIDEIDELEIFDRYDDAVEAHLIDEVAH